MSRAKATVRPKIAKRPLQDFRGDLLDAATRKLQLVDAIVQCSERAATHDLVEVHQLADVLVALAEMIEQALDVLDVCEVASKKKGGAP